MSRDQYLYPVRWFLVQHRDGHCLCRGHLASKVGTFMRGNLGLLDPQVTPIGPDDRATVRAFGCPEYDTVVGTPRNP